MLTVGAAVLVLAAPARTLHAASLSVGLLSGTTIDDARLADYQWDARAKAGLGAEARASVARGSVALRLWRSSTTQQLDATLASASPDVHRDRAELVGRVTLVRVLGAQWSLQGGAGLLHLGYAPDHVDVATGTGTSTTVRLAPIDTGSASVGVAVEHPLVAGWAASGEATREWFALDTAHRSGADIVRAHETFADWTIRLGLSYRILGR
jgi:hypothetical protein